MVSPKDKKAMEQLSLLKEHKAQLVALQKETTQDTLLAIEDKLLDDSISIVNECNEFANMGFDEGNGQPIVPESWKYLEPDVLAKRVRLAKANWMPSSDVPHGIKMAYATAVSIIKSRALKESGGKSLHIENAVFPAPAPLGQANDLPVIDVEE